MKTRFDRRAIWFAKRRLWAQSHIAHNQFDFCALAWRPRIDPESPVVSADLFAHDPRFTLTARIAFPGLTRPYFFGSGWMVTDTSPT